MKCAEKRQKHKADIGRCKIAKQKIEVEPETQPQSEGPKPHKTAKADQEVENLPLLKVIQSSFSLWDSGIVLVKKKSG